jgi:hypothetical protein
MTDGVRFEPLPRADEVASGLAARVHDALWLLTRQWQFGEFQAQDAGSPAEVAVTGTSRPVDAWSVDEKHWLPYTPATTPFDAVCEAEPRRAPDLRERAIGGLRFVRLLTAAGLTQAAARIGLDHPFPMADVAPGATAPGDSFAALLVRRAPDALALTAAIDAGTLVLPEASAAQAASVLGPWRAWWRAEHEPDPSALDSYDPSRLEHRFALRCGDAVLRATEYGADGVGRHSFDLDLAAADVAAAGGPPAAALPVEGYGLPAPLRFPGIPADRFWEMEDARIDLGSADVSRLDTGRLLLVAFATVYGNDWFTVPLEVAAGSLTTIDRVLVKDVFGEQHLVERAGSDQTGWNLFTLSPPARPSGGPGQWPDPGDPRTGALFVPPAAVRVDTGAASESVLLARDETANLAWAVEHTYTDEQGELVDRKERWLRAGSAVDPLPELTGPDPRYVVQTEVPDYWLPLVPKRTDAGAVQLCLVPLRQVAPGGPATGESPAIEESLPMGRLLTRGLWIHDEELPRSGTLVGRVPALTRGGDGRYHAWTRRTSDIGRGEADSGLRFDTVRPSDPWP